MGKIVGRSAKSALSDHSLETSQEGVRLHSLPRATAPTPALLRLICRWLLVVLPLAQS